MYTAMRNKLRKNKGTEVSSRTRAGAPIELGTLSAEINVERKSIQIKSWFLSIWGNTGEKYSGKPQYPGRKNSQRRVENQQTQPTSTGSHWWEASALTCPLRQLSSTDLIIITTEHAGILQAISFLRCV